MKVVDHLTSKNPFLSVEIIPPKRGSNLKKIYDAIETILPYNPAYIDITSHAAEVIWEEMPGGIFKRTVKRKSPGTFGLCAAIKYKFNVDPVPHILCNGFTREETEDALIELNFLGVENLFLIRGDGSDKPIAPGRTINSFAIDLVQQVNAMNQGHYLDELIDADATNFCIGVATYPEKHFEAPSMNFDINILKKKQEAGAHYAVCQMFFDNQVYFDFCQKAKDAGIHIPIVPGLKILTTKKHLTVIPRTFHVDMPDELIEQIQNASNDKQVQEIGIEWTYRQSLDLLDKGVKNLHYYIMQNTQPFIKLMDKVKKHI